MNTSSEGKPLYVYLQRPDNGEWVVAGAYRKDNDGITGHFKYAPSYAERALHWAIDPVNLPFLPAMDHLARRYGGLHDVLRDASPDSWGQTLLRRAHNLPANTPHVQYLVLSGNGDRWGALAVGKTARPDVAKRASPKLDKLDALVDELLAISEHRPPVNAQLRKKLFATPSLGGARPKATVQDNGTFWLVKPGLATDTVDLALLEHVTQQWGRQAALRFADTRHHILAGGRSVVRVLRFDRAGTRRVMAVSAASLLQVQYPFITPEDSQGASYPRLAEELKRIGAPDEDLKELFGRMVFNAAVGNDDDHPRNHAVIFDLEEKRWRLAPAFDVVPNPDEVPAALMMQLSSGRTDISQEAMLLDFARFGFASKAEAAACLEALIDRIDHGFDQLKHLLSDSLRELMEQRMAVALQRLTPHRQARPRLS